MNFTVAYRGRSGVTGSSGGVAVSFAPNLRRDRVAFAADLRQDADVERAAVLYVA